MKKHIDQGNEYGFDKITLSGYITEELDSLKGIGPDLLTGPIRVRPLSHKSADESGNFCDNVI